MLMTMVIIIVITIIIVLFCLIICWFVCCCFSTCPASSFRCFILPERYVLDHTVVPGVIQFFVVIVVCLPDRYVLGIPVAQRLMCWVPSSSQVSLPDGNMLGLANMPGVIQFFVFVVVVVDVVVVVFLPDINALGLADVPDSWQV